MDTLTEIKRAASRRASSEQTFRAKIRQGQAEGLSLRAIAKAAGVSHVRVLQITRDP